MMALQVWLLHAHRLQGSKFWTKLGFMQNLGASMHPVALPTILLTTRRAPNSMGG